MPPSRPQELAGPPAARLVVGLDVGGTTLKGALVGEQGEHTRLRREPTGAAEGPEAVLARAGGLLAELLAEAERLSGKPSPAIGVAVPGVVDDAAGVVRLSANLGWRELDLRGHLEGLLGRPVVVLHDVLAAGLAEGRLGVARSVQDYLFLSLGTGVAATLFVGGRPSRGAHLLAGEIGHLTVESGGRPCGCGGRGCLETVASATAIAGRYAERSGAAGRPGPSRASQASQASPWGGGLDPVGTEEVLRRAAAGDPLAVAVRDEAIRALAQTLSFAQHLVDTDLVVLGGGLAQAGEAFLAPLAAETSARCIVARPPRFARSALGTEGGCIGAGLAAWAGGRP